MIQLYQIYKEWLAIYIPGMKGLNWERADNNTFID